MVISIMASPPIRVLKRNLIHGIPECHEDSPLWSTRPLRLRGQKKAGHLDNKSGATKQDSQECLGLSKTGKIAWVSKLLTFQMQRDEFHP